MTDKKLDASIRAQFEHDADEWYRETSHMSVVRDMKEVDSYKRILELGPLAVPLIIERLRSGKNAHLFNALYDIVGEDKATGSTTIPMAVQRWIEWYDSEGHLEY